MKTIPRWGDRLNMNSVDQSIASFLSRLEIIESRLLSWGMVDGSFTHDELKNHAIQFLTQNDLWGEIDTEEVFVDQLEERGLLFSFLDGAEIRYRTRMGEAIRLVARLRQLFPKHLNNRKWQTAPTLVADYRLLIRPREFPCRDLPYEKIVDAINEVRKLNKLQLDVLGAILGLELAKPFELAGFQLRATESILRGVGKSLSTGTITCAGTGSGKTLAFYLPAFIELVNSLDDTFWTRCVALYPRNELLKDQFSETFRQARRIDSVLKKHGRRKLRLGTLFASTPTAAKYFKHDNPPRGWISVGNGFVCPYLNCPTEGCDGQLVWLDVDRKQQIERLCCSSSSCEATTQPDEILLTRESIKRCPPDILFTTTEMLNQRMSDSSFSHLFGIGRAPKQRPLMVLLDEVHTYSGVSGAQVALLLRRWQRMATFKPHFVGLSATLSDARNFFAQLVGIPDFRVAEISPHSNEINRRSMDYMLAVRGDPASGASLLSTTIQTAMLMRRIQDPTGINRSRGLYGTREFIFTDDLDVTNRLFFNLRDAEGQDSWGRPGPDGSLANLRRSQGVDNNLRFRFGQSWDLCEKIGHKLDGQTEMSVERTSSQDIGVKTQSDMIVATASLEVGFNDPDVNVVLQHKAPRSAAQFVQRKGRAGRRTEMRPWTVVVLSDYGRDRLAWQNYDLLFNPELPPRDLPVSNRYVLRIQAVFAFLDWIAGQLSDSKNVPEGSVWQDFSGPLFELGSVYQHKARPRRQVVSSIVEELLTNDRRQNDLSIYLQEALHQDQEVVDALMWDPPRALMSAVLPTLLRRLKTDWALASSSGGGEPAAYDFYVSNNPLPEFVPGRLYADLNLPEIAISTPSQQKDDSPRVELMPIVQALREFAPGRVSRRFGIRNQHARHWIAMPDIAPGPTKHIQLDQYVHRYDEIGTFQYFDEQGVQSVRCIRPVELHPQAPCRNVQDSTNAFLQWDTQIVAETDGFQVDLPSPFRWEGIIRDIRFFTHNNQMPLENRRFARASDTSVVLTDGRKFESRLCFVDAGRTGVDDDLSESAPVAVGFAVSVDGLMIRVEIPDEVSDGGGTPNHAKLRALRTSLFRDRVIGDESLDGIVNSFRRRWLAEVYLSALVYAALSNNRPLADEWEIAKTENTALNFVDVLDIIFQSIPVNDDDVEQNGSEQDEDAGSDQVRQRLYHDLAELFDDQEIIETLHRHAPVLWQAPGKTWRVWLERKFKTTLGAAVLDAIQQLCPDLDVGDLVLDIDPGPSTAEVNPSTKGLHEIWFTERTVGGGGVIEKLMARYGEDPRRFFDLVEAALKPSDFEIVDEQLTVFLEWAADSEERDIRDQLALLRRMRLESHDAYAAAFDDLIKLLSQRGLFVCHSVVAAMSTRILRPGSTAETDRLLNELILSWRQQENQLGIDVDSRIFAYLKSGESTLDKALECVIGDATAGDRRQWRFGALLSLLWPRGSTIRGRRLSVYNPFSNLPDSEHDLVRDCLPHDVDVVFVTSPGWFVKAKECLIRCSAVILRADDRRTNVLRESMVSLMVEPVDTGLLLLYPRVRKTERQVGYVDVMFELAEGVQ